MAPPAAATRVLLATALAGCAASVLALRRVASKRRVHTHASVVQVPLPTKMQPRTAPALASDTTSLSSPGPSEHQAPSCATSSSSRDPDRIQALVLGRNASRAAVASAVRALTASAEGVIGLDAEWQPEVTPGQVHRISVLQLASRDAVIVFQPHPDATSLPAEIVDLLADPHIVKAGVGILEDIKRLRRDFNAVVRSCIDARVVAAVLRPSALSQGGSMRGLTSALLGRDLDKSMQRSQWQAEVLSEEQVVYAAQDAWLSRRLLVELCCGTDAATATATATSTAEVVVAAMAGETAGAAAVPMTAAATTASTTVTATAPATAATSGYITAAVNAAATTPTVAPSQTAAAKAIAPTAPSTWPPSSAAGSFSYFTFLQPYLDRFYNGSSSTAGNSNNSGAPKDRRNGGTSSTSLALGNGGKEGDSDLTKQPRKPSKLPTRKSVLYENCRILAPDGAVLCTCGRKKIQWYLDRGIASLVPPSESGTASDSGVDEGPANAPLTILLHFEPRGRGHADDHYYLADKENKCTVCGATGHYSRHSIVPHCYRQYFPLAMKSHLSHDIVLLCSPCHQACSMDVQQRMEGLGAASGHPLSADTARFTHNEGLGRVRSAGRALANKKVSIPPARRAQLEAVVRAHLGLAEDTPLSEAHIEEASNVDPRVEEQGWVSHAEQLVGRMSVSELEEFVRGWRRHFLEIMKPRFLPPYWSVDSRVVNSASAASELQQHQQGQGHAKQNQQEQTGKQEQQHRPQQQCMTGLELREANDMLLLEEEGEEEEEEEAMEEQQSR